MELSWILELDGRGAVAEPHCDAATVAAALALLGEGPVRWAVAVGEGMARRILSRVPEHGVGPAPFETLRRAAESAVLTCLYALVDDGHTPWRVPGDGIEAVRDFVRRGIPLDRVLRGVRVGHAFLHTVLREAAPEGRMPARVTELLFELADWLSGELAEVYVAERDRWEVSEEAGRCRVAEAIISGEHTDVPTAERVLDYALDRHHVAVILWREVPADAAMHTQQLVGDLVAASGGEGMLCVAGHAATVWLWIGFGTLPDRLSWPPRLPKGWRAVAGPPSYGLPGVRRSHLSARRAARITAALPAAGVCDYADVRTACLLTGDAEHARWYVQETLGVLAARDAWSGRLRETLRCYLTSGRSLKTAAERLGLARNTVAYRVKHAKQLLGPGRQADLLEVALALEIMRFPGGLEAEPTSGDAPDRVRHMYVKTGLVP